MGEYGYQAVVLGFELVGDIDPAELDEARAIVAAKMRPCAAMVIKQELARLRVKTTSRATGQDDLALTFSVYAEELARYPEDIVIATCRAPRGHGFWPQWEELRAVADRLLKERRDLAEALAQGPRRVVPNPEAVKMREAIAKRDRQWAEAAQHRAAHPELHNQPALTWAQSLALSQGKSLPTVLRIAGDESDAKSIDDAAQRWLAEMGEAV
jgi:hypothetical protein